MNPDLSDPYKRLAWRVVQAQAQQEEEEDEGSEESED